MNQEFEQRLKQIKKNIATWSRKFDDGDIGFGFKLFDLYNDGEYRRNDSYEKDYIFKPDKFVADQYLKRCKQMLDEQRDQHSLYVTHLTLTEFRKFNKLDVALEQILTVFIGDNGAGKTSILEAIQKVLSWVSANIVKQGGRGQLVTVNDVNNESKTLAQVSLQLALNNKSNYRTVLRKTAKGAKTSYKSDISGAEELGSLYRWVNAMCEEQQLETTGLPIMAFYSASRMQNNGNKTYDLEKIAAVDTSSKFDAYANHVNASNNFDDFLQWFMSLSDLAGGGGIAKALADAEKTFNALVNTGADNADNPLHEVYVEARQKYHSSKHEYENKAKYIKRLDEVKQAILNTLLDFTDMYITRDGGRAELVVTTNAKQSINVHQASDGQRAVMGLVGSIAMKLVMLNPEHNQPLHGFGVVLIDEIELHLHPKWQRNIIKSLRETFPCVQFIITTHSPQVLSTVDKSCIRYFTENKAGDELFVSPRYQTKGVTSTDVLAHIMGVDSKPDVEEAHMVERFANLLQQKQKEEALRVFERIFKHFGEGHPVVTQCEGKLNVYEMRERVRAKRKAQ